LSAADAHFLKAIASHVRKQPAEVLAHIEQGLDSLMTSPWCRIPLVGEAVTLLGELARSKEVVQDPRFLVIFDKLSRDYPVHVARTTLLGMRCEMAMHLKVPQQLAAIESLGLPYPWHGRTLALRVSAYMQANDPRLEMAMADMNRFLDQGGTIGGEAPPFVVQVKRPVPAVAPVQPMVIGSQAGE
ncbi:MAG: hypothetical protein NTY98_26460, partial [Verrucomicrobia bacterium]|nr:hypothetical protein [Verrucomicrobiota bacterium]